MDIIVSQESLVDVIAYDNMINAFIARLFIAVKNHNESLMLHYQKEILVATASRKALLENVINGDFSVSL